MKRHHWSLFAFLSLILTLFGGGKRSSASADLLLPGTLDSVGHSDWIFDDTRPANPLPVMRAVDPEEERLRPREPSDPIRPLLRERDAILPNPLSGRELVDHTIVIESESRPLHAPSEIGVMPRRVTHRQWAAAKFVVPVTSGM